MVWHAFKQAQYAQNLYYFTCHSFEILFVMLFDQHFELQGQKHNNFDNGHSQPDSCIANARVMEEHEEENNEAKWIPKEDNKDNDEYACDPHCSSCDFAPLVIHVVHLCSTTTRYCNSSSKILLLL